LWRSWGCGDGWSGRLRFGSMCA